MGLCFSGEKRHKPFVRHLVCREIPLHRGVINSVSYCSGMSCEVSMAAILHSSFQSRLLMANCL